jgi:RNA polymerase sigma-70 factor
MMQGNRAAAACKTTEPEASRDSFYRRAAEAYEQGYRCHGDLGMDCEAFAGRLLGIARKYLGPEAPWIAITNFVGKLHTDDLYLTSGCARNSEAAWHRFHSMYRKCVQSLFHYVWAQADAAHELADLTMIDMFLPDRSGDSRIASYDGRSTLTTWLRVIVSNRAINERQRMWNRMQRVEPSADIADTDALRTVESGLQTKRYEGVFRDSLWSVCLELTAQERLILLWRYEEGLQLGQIARLLGVHQSTVTRQLERLMKRMRGDVVSVLASKYQLSPAAIEECLSVILETSSHSISLLGLIKEAPSDAAQQTAGRMPIRRRGVASSRGNCAPGGRGGE